MTQILGINCTGIYAVHSIIKIDLLDNTDIRDEIEQLVRDSYKPADPSEAVVEDQDVEEEFTEDDDILGIDM